jgi:hypothetical protein
MVMPAGRQAELVIEMLLSQKTALCRSEGLVRMTHLGGVASDEFPVFGALREHFSRYQRRIFEMCSFSSGSAATTVRLNAHHSAPAPARP